MWQSFRFFWGDTKKLKTPCLEQLSPVREPGSGECIYSLLTGAGSKHTAAWCAARSLIGRFGCCGQDWKGGPHSGAACISLRMVIWHPTHLCAWANRYVRNLVFVRMCPCIPYMPCSSLNFIHGRQLVELLLHGGHGQSQLPHHLSETVGVSGGSGALSGRHGGDSRDQ